MQKKSLWMKTAKKSQQALLLCETILRSQTVRAMCQYMARVSRSLCTLQVLCAYLTYPVSRQRLVQHHMKTLYLVDVSTAVPGVPCYHRLPCPSVQADDAIVLELIQGRAVMSRCF